MVVIHLDIGQTDYFNLFIHYLMLFTFLLHFINMASSFYFQVFLIHLMWFQISLSLLLVSLVLSFATMGIILSSGTVVLYFMYNA